MYVFKTLGKSSEKRDKLINKKQELENQKNILLKGVQLYWQMIFFWREFNYTDSLIRPYTQRSNLSALDT